MSFSLLPTESNNKIIIASGEVFPGDDEKLHRFVSGLSSKFEIIGIILSSPGGNYIEGVRLATSIRNSHIRSGVAPKGICASACFLMFAAGTEKLLFEGARLGVHSASNASGSESVSSQAVTTLMARKASELGVPPVVIGKMVTTPASEITWLDDSDLQAMGAIRAESQMAAYEPGAALKPGNGDKALPAPSIPTRPSSAPDLLQKGPVPLPQMEATHATPSPPSVAFQEGALDRTAYETWFSTLTGDVRLGASWWAENRSRAARNRLTCARPDVSPNFTLGCSLTQTMLTPFDRRRLSETDYRAGWNSI